MRTIDCYKEGYDSYKNGTPEYKALINTLSPTYRQQFETAFKQSMQSSNKSLKTNPGKNKYIVNVSSKSYYMKKL